MNSVKLDGLGIIVIDVVGDQTVESVEHMGHEINALITEQRKIGKSSLILDNLLQIGVVGPDARKKVVALAKELDFDRAVMVGKGGLMRFGTNLMLRATGRSHNVRYYDNEQEARSWLKAFGHRDAS
jgi:hypothetical protein